MLRFAPLIVVLVVAVLLVPSPATPTHDVEKLLLGAWKLESDYTEFQATGEKEKQDPGDESSGYLVFTRYNRMFQIITIERRREARPDEERVPAFRSSIVAYSGIYRIEGDKLITKVDAAWGEPEPRSGGVTARVGTERMGSFMVEGDRLDVASMWQNNRVLIWSRLRTGSVKAQ